MWRWVIAFVSSLNDLELALLVAVYVVAAFHVIAAVAEWYNRREDRRDESRYRDPAAPRVVWPRPSRDSDRPYVRRLAPRTATPDKSRGLSQSVGVAAKGLDPDSCYTTTVLRFPDGDAA